MRILAPFSNFKPVPPRKAVAIVRGFPAARTPGAWAERVIRLVPGARAWWSYRDQFMEFVANPRSLAYMLAWLDTMFEQCLPGVRPDLIVAGDTGPDQMPPGTILAEDTPAALARLVVDGGYDTVVLLYRDAIGLGWSEAEAALARVPGIAVYAVTGRRRAFLLDGEARSKLRLRRWLAASRVVEIGFGLAAILVSGLLGAVDFARGRR